MEDHFVQIGERETWGSAQPFGLFRADRRQHTYVIGKTGSGKSTLLRNLILQDIEAGEGVGLPSDLALRLARETVAGSGELARLSPDSPARLRENVTSPGGTTRAALDVLMADDGLARLLERAVAAATARSRELAS